MKLEQLERAKAIEKEIADYVMHRNALFDRSERFTLFLDHGAYYGKRVELRDEFLPVQRKAFFDLYIVMVNTKIKELETEFEAL